MATEYRHWPFTETEQLKFHEWTQRINHVHSGTTDVRNPSLNWTPLRKPLSECVVSLLTTGGVHLRDDTPFDTDSTHGDWTHREIPTATPTPTTAAAAPTPTTAAAAPAATEEPEETSAPEEYAARHAGGPGAIYVGDIAQLVGPAPSESQGDFDGNVTLGDLERHVWVYESNIYQELPDKARLTDPTPLESSGETITIQHACINRALLPCQLLETYFTPNLLERTDGQVNFVVSSFPELGLAGYAEPGFREDPGFGQHLWRLRSWGAASPGDSEPMGYLRIQGAGVQGHSGHHQGH